MLRELANQQIVLGALGCGLLLQLGVWGASILQGPQLPPGPPKKPLVGNFFQMPTRHEWKTFARWAKEFGDLFSLKVFTQPIIVVNSVEAAHEIFEKKSSVYSDRPELPMLNDLMGFDWNMGMMHYGERWRRHRKIFHRFSNPEAAEGYLDIQLRHTREFLPKLSKAPDDVLRHMRHLAGAFIMEMVYGIKVKAQEDPYIELAEKAVDGLIAAAVPGAFLVDTLPFLKYIPEWVPGASFQTKARIWRKYVVGMCVAPFEAVKAALHAGTARNSMAASLLEELSSSSDVPADEEEIIRNTTAVAYLGGTDTTSTALSWFVLAMVIYPDVQRKAQAEIDSIVESDRLPEFEDRKHLPYINAICKESLRWNPVAPLAIPHRATEDSLYGEYLIPKGSIVLGNAWGILHNEKTYGANPEEFEPERFLKPGIPDPDTAFGFGRRVCPGKYIADHLMFIVIASILKMYDIIPAKDACGNQISVDVSSASGAVAGPHPFKCVIKPRSADAERILDQLEFGEY